MVFKMTIAVATRHYLTGMKITFTSSISAEIFRKKKRGGQLLFLEIKLTF